MLQIGYVKNCKISLIFCLILLSVCYGVYYHCKVSKLKYLSYTIVFQVYVISTACLFPKCVPQNVAVTLIYMVMMKEKSCVYNFLNAIFNCIPTVEQLQTCMWSRPAAYAHLVSRNIISILFYIILFCFNTAVLIFRNGFTVCYFLSHCIINFGNLILTSCS